MQAKGGGTLSYHHGCGYTRDEDGTLVADQGNMLAKSLSPMKRCLEENQRKLKRHWYQQTIQRMNYLIFCE